MKFFEDIAIGERVELGHWHVTAEATVAFARRYDPQGFHLEETEAAKTHFGRLSASGWQTAAMWMKHMIAHRDRVQAEMRARGEPVADMGPSPGFTDMRWLKPVFPGDRITFFTTATEARPSQSRPRWGLIRHLNEGVNQTGDLVFSFIGNVFVERRDA